MENEETVNTTSPENTTLAPPRYLKTQITKWHEIESNKETKKKIEVLKNEAINLNAKHSQNLLSTTKYY